MRYGFINCYYGLPAIFFRMVGGVPRLFVEDLIRVFRGVRGVPRFFWKDFILLFALAWVGLLWLLPVSIWVKAVFAEPAIVVGVVSFRTTLGGLVPVSWVPSFYLAFLILAIISEVSLLPF